MGARQQRSSVAAGLLWSAVLVIFASGCGSSSISVTSPTGSKCSVTVSNSMATVPAAGATGTLTIKTNRECTWSASTATAWISLMSSANGQGEATLSYRVEANVDPSPRHGVVTVNDTTADITQDAAPCRFTVAPLVAPTPAAGGSVSLAVTASSQICAWTAASTTSWITLPPGSSGTGNGTVTLNVLPNGGEAREGTATVAGQTVTVTQPALGTEQPAPLPAPGPTPPPAPAPTPAPTPAPAPTTCSFTLEPATQTVAAAGGTGTVAVTSGNGCTWTASSPASWIAITAGTSGLGNGTVTFSAAANSGASRSATIQIGTATATVSQPAASCSFTIAPTSQSVPAAGGTGSVAVTAGANCEWTARDDVSWISITSGASGSGNGTVNFTVSANSGAARSTTLTIAGKTFTVSQEAAACTVAIAPTGQSVPAAGGTGTISITAPAGCAWTATVNASWLVITNPTSGSGNGSIGFTANVNTGAARSGTITIAGQTFTIEQAAGTACSFGLSAASQSVSANGGNGSATVTTASTCAWTAASNASWITVTSGASVTGPGSVAFAIAANTGAARSGTLTIAGQTFTVNQDGAPCSFAISPNSQNVGAAGGTGSATVTAAAGCAWTATSNASWIVVSSGASGTGNGPVGFTVGANTGASRTGTLTIAGQTFTVSQDAVPCTFTVAPTTVTVVVAGGSGSVAVTAGAGCAWTASSNAGWLSITSGSSGTGNGTVSFSGTANSSGTGRTGTLTVAGQTVTVMQAGS
jgi:all-beta uncharacterized protein/BACON domain-containing protein